MFFCGFATFIHCLYSCCIQICIASMKNWATASMPKNSSMTSQPLVNVATKSFSCYPTIKIYLKGKILGIYKKTFEGSIPTLYIYIYIIPSIFPLKWLVLPCFTQKNLPYRGLASSNNMSRLSMTSGHGVRRGVGSEPTVKGMYWGFLMGI